MLHLDHISYHSISAVFTLLLQLFGRIKERIPAIELLKSETAKERVTGLPRAPGSPASIRAIYHIFYVSLSYTLHIFIRQLFGVENYHQKGQSCEFKVHIL